MRRHEVPTPALILDLDAFERNLARMAAHARNRRLGLRPHAKTHKCPEIARAQIAAGAVGICTAKLSEAEVFASAGIRGLLVTTAVIGGAKIERALLLAAQAPDTIFVVDHQENAQDLADAARRAGLRLNAAVELHVGRRSGIAPGAPAVALVESMTRMKELRFAGLQAYAGYCAHVEGFQERRKASIEAMTQAIETRRMLEKKGIAVGLVSGGSTGTYNIDSELEGMTELQPGSYLFMDLDYRRIGSRGTERFTDFEFALTVAATVVSRPEPAKAIIDAGFKAFATDKPYLPEDAGGSGVVYGFAGDEHGRLDCSQAAREIRVGDRLEFFVPHCDPTVNLYDRIYAVRGDLVDQVWQVAARGMSQ